MGISEQNDSLENEDRLAPAAVKLIENIIRKRRILELLIVSSLAVLISFFTANYMNLSHILAIEEETKQLREDRLDFERSILKEFKNSREELYLSQDKVGELKADLFIIKSTVNELSTQIKLMQQIMNTQREASE